MEIPVQGDGATNLQQQQQAINFAEQAKGAHLSSYAFVASSNYRNDGKLTTVPFGDPVKSCVLVAISAGGGVPAQAGKVLDFQCEIWVNRVRTKVAVLR